MSRLGGLSRNEDERATTPSPRTPVNATAISSVMPPAKKSWVASPELFSSGSTATIGRGGAGACAAANGSAAQSASAVAAATPKCRVKFVRNPFMRSLPSGLTPTFDSQMLGQVSPPIC